MVQGAGKAISPGPWVQARAGVCTRLAEGDLPGPQPKRQQGQQGRCV